MQPDGPGSGAVHRGIHNDSRSVWEAVLASARAEDVSKITRCVRGALCTAAVGQPDKPSFSAIVVSCLWGTRWALALATLCCASMGTWWHELSRGAASGPAPDI